MNSYSYYLEGIFFIFFILFILMQRQEKMIYKSLAFLQSVSSFPVLGK